MKKFYKFITLLMFITLSTNLMATDYVLSGAGTTEVNGSYVENGTHYWASQTVNGVESTDRFDVLVNMSNP
jgi:hypothetical protein